MRPSCLLGVFQPLLVPRPLTIFELHHMVLLTGTGYDPGGASPESPPTNRVAVLAHLEVLLDDVRAASAGWAWGALRRPPQVVARHRTTSRSWNGFMRFPVSASSFRNLKGLPPRSLNSPCWSGYLLLLISSCALVVIGCTCWHSINDPIRVLSLTLSAVGPASSFINRRLGEARGGGTWNNNFVPFVKF